MCCETIIPNLGKGGEVEAQPLKKLSMPLTNMSVCLTQYGCKWGGTGNSLGIPFHNFISIFLIIKYKNYI